ncbi:MAG: hypothetical protein JSU78_05675 [Deltaproteobacteria bacterium]|nr:MAG: hypothetical protein JSU78_05675 [Deltaproteobacteria bacterium]
MLPVGGIKGKVLEAGWSGIQHVIFLQGNKDA